MINISQESLNFSLSDNILLFQTNQVLRFTENIQDGSQYILIQQTTSWITLQLMAQ